MQPQLAYHAQPLLLINITFVFKRHQINTALDDVDRAIMTRLLSEIAFTWLIYGIQSTILLIGTILKEIEYTKPFCVCILIYLFIYLKKTEQMEINLDENIILHNSA